jgi:NAD(P)-dependent dehydrogenase (short-subunit alcohol dehydrogenase family)
VIGGAHAPCAGHRHAARQIEKHAGRLDALVNNAGATGAWPQNPTTLNLDQCPGIGLATYPGVRLFLDMAQEPID